MLDQPLGSVIPQIAILPTTNHDRLIGTVNVFCGLVVDSIAI